MCQSLNLQPLTASGVSAPRSCRSHPPFSILPGVALTLRVTVFLHVRLVLPCRTRRAFLYTAGNSSAEWSYLQGLCYDKIVWPTYLTKLEPGSPTQEIQLQLLTWAYSESLHIRPPPAASSPRPAPAPGFHRPGPPTVDAEHPWACGRVSGLRCAQYIVRGEAGGTSLVCSHSVQSYTFL